jgi:hypothetical protein
MGDNNFHMTKNIKNALLQFQKTAIPKAKNSPAVSDLEIQFNVSQSTRHPISKRQRVLFFSAALNKHD